MGNSIYKPLIDSMRWSFSRLSSFENCRYAWYLKYLYGLKEEPNFYASYGSFVHKLIEKYYRDEISHQDLYSEFLVGFPFAVKGRRPNKKIVQNYLESGAAYFAAFKPLPYQKIEAEESLEFDINGKHFVGIVDYIGADGDDLVIVDHKSRTLEPRSGREKPTAKDRMLDEYLRQLYIYAEGVRQKYGVFPKKLCFNCFRNGNFIEEPFRKDAFESAISWAQDVIKKTGEVDEFLPTLDWFYCTHLCGFRNSCCYYDLIRGDRHKRK